MADFFLWTLALLSLAVWSQVVLRLRVSEPPLPFRARPENVWSPAATFVAALLVAEQLSRRVQIEISGKSTTISAEGIQQSALMQLFCVAVLFSFLVWPRQHPIADFGIRFDRLGHQIIDGVLGFLASFLPVWLIMLAMFPLRNPESQHSFLRLLQQDAGASTVVWIAISVVIVAPLSEELIYRVILQRALQKWVSPRWAIVLVAVLFCIGHGWTDALPLFPLALLFGYVYHRRNSYLSVVLMHALFNGTMLTMQLLSLPAEAKTPPGDAEATVRQIESEAFSPQRSASERPRNALSAG
jgi:hypothetical protein